MIANNKAVKGEGLLLPPRGLNEERTNRERASSWRWWPSRKGEAQEVGRERAGEEGEAGQGLESRFLYCFGFSGVGSVGRAEKVPMAILHI